MDTLMVWKWRKHKVPLEVHCVSLRDSLNQSVDDEAVSWSMVFRGRLLSLNSWKKAKYPIRRSFVNLWLELSLVTLDNMWKSGHYWFPSWRRWSVSKRWLIAMSLLILCLICEPWWLHVDGWCLQSFRCFNPVNRKSPVHCPSIRWSWPRTLQMRVVMLWFW